MARAKTSSSVMRNCSMLNRILIIEMIVFIRQLVPVVLGKCLRIGKLASVMVWTAITQSGKFRLVFVSQAEDQQRSVHRNILESTLNPIAISLIVINTGHFKKCYSFYSSGGEIIVLVSSSRTIGLPHHLISSLVTIVRGHILRVRSLLLCTIILKFCRQHLKEYGIFLYIS